MNATRTIVAAAVIVAAPFIGVKASTADATATADTNYQSPFSGFRNAGWHRITLSEADVLAESGRRNADTRVWERCATNNNRIVCPGGYVTKWDNYEWEGK